MPTAESEPYTPALRVAFQGETGAFSEEAVRALFGTDGVPVPHASFRAAFEAVAAGDVDRALLPIENARFGSVHANVDLLREYGLPIVGEVHLRIRHHLMARPGTALADVRRVRSHPQALGQCDAWLRAHLPDAEIVPDYDTAGAARRLADAMLGGEALDGEAAIASAAAADEYGLDVLAARIEGDPNNVTRFLAIAREAAGGGGEVQDRATPTHKTSLVFALRDNVPGALFKSLAVFALRDLDLLKIESRPLVGSPGQYLFYLDVRGAATDRPVARALDHLADFAARVQVLGSYPAGRRVD